MNDALWRTLSSGRLQWLPSEGLGFCDVTGFSYDAAYWKKYRELDDSECGAKLTAARLELVARHWAGNVVDVGIGGGRFVRERGCMGYDVNPHAVRWLRDGKRFRDPYQQPIDAATFWDSLEHIADPAALLQSVRRWVFVSIPIFRNADEVLRSKHYKPGEHVWYFTKDGFLRFMERFGWRCEEVNAAEIAAGREDILSFAFTRHTESE